MDRRPVVFLFSTLFATAAAAKLARGAAQSGSPPAPRLQNRFSANYTANLAFQDPAGGTNSPPDYESVHLMTDGRIASIGWIGIHADNFSNAIFAFNPATNAVDLLAPWEQYVSAKDLTPKIPPVRGAGYNKNCSTYDNHPSAYFAATNSLIWFGHGVFDVGAGQYIRGDRPPMTRKWETYATGHNGMWSTYNPAYAQCLALNVVAFYGSSHGGYGTGTKEIVLWKNTGPADAPWQAIRFDLAASGIAALALARNNAACIGTKIYIGGGLGGQSAGSIANSVFTQPRHGYRDGYEVVPLSDLGQDGMPAGLNYNQVYFVRDVVADTFRVSATRGGPALTVADRAPWSFQQQYKMWSIDLATSPPSVEMVSTEWALGAADRYPQLKPDTRRNRLVLIGKQVSVFDPVSRAWSAVAVRGWPAGGYKSVGGAYVAAKDKIYFRGTPISYRTGPQPWQWNSIEFTMSAQ